MTSMSDFRPLQPAEISALRAQQNRAENWKKIFIQSQTDIGLIYNSVFSGTVYIGILKKESSVSDFPAGITDCRLKDVVIGDNCALHNVKQIIGYTIGHHSILFNVGIIDGREPFKSFEIRVSNENGGRAIQAFPGMNGGDAWLQSRHKEDTALHEHMQSLARKAVAPFCERPETGAHSRLINCQHIQASYIGPHACIENCVAIKNSIILSSGKAPSKIENGVILEDVILDRQNTVKNHVVLTRVATGENVRFENAARVTDCFVGANSTIACGEAVSNLLFAFHEQHHNNSFLIAAQTGGQCNIAAGATIGSNHNSRAADGELIAGRGFWPGLETDFKHNSHFASFTLIAKSSFDKELDIHLPFSLVSKNNDGRVVIYPAYWYYYNMYALARNAWKFSARDKRTEKRLLIETDFLGPDSLTEMMAGIRFLSDFLSLKHPLIEVMQNPEGIKAPRVIEAEGLVLKEKALILNPLKAVIAYTRLLTFFCGRTFLASLTPDLNPGEKWENFGGQFIPAREADGLRRTIRSGEISSWEDIHAFYRQQAKIYPRYLHALAGQIARFITGKERLSASDHRNLRRLAADIAGDMMRGTRESREKDFENFFRKKSYLNTDEMKAVLVTPDRDPFLPDYRKSMEKLINALNSNETNGDPNGET